MHFLCIYSYELACVGSTHTEVLSISVTAFGNRVIKEVIQVQWDHKSGALSDRTGAFIGRRRHTRDPSLCVPLYVHAKERPCGHTVSKRGLSRNQILAALRSWFLASSYEKRNFCCLSHLFSGIFYGSLSRLHRHTHTRMRVCLYVSHYNLVVIYNEYQILFCNIYSVYSKITDIFLIPQCLNISILQKVKILCFKNMKSILFWGEYTEFDNATGVNVLYESFMELFHYNCDSA